MKLLALAAAGLLAGSALAVPAPAEAQRYHHRDYGRHHGWGGPRHGFAPRYRYGPRYAYGPRYRYGGYRGRSRTVCRLHRGYYGPVRRCHRVW